jgi:hypothetical protein
MQGRSVRIEVGRAVAFGSPFYPRNRGDRRQGTLLCLNRQTNSRPVLPPRRGDLNP